MTLAQVIALHQRTESGRWGKTFIRGKQARALKRIPEEEMKLRSDLLLDLAGLVGLAIVAGGLWWIYPPAGVIFTGLAVVAVAWVIAKLWVQ